MSHTVQNTTSIIQPKTIDQSTHIQNQTNLALFEMMGTTSELLLTFQENNEAQSNRINNLKTKIKTERLQHVNEIKALKEQYEIKLKNLEESKDATIQKQNGLINALMKVKELIDSYPLYPPRDDTSGMSAMNMLYFFRDWFGLLNPAINFELNKL
ncbi:MAG: hypothetical protein JHC93_05855 [Parachlamydiales bacterium]|nr:hypothetical protein [Parachlamydiales bacterium]